MFLAQVLLTATAAIAIGTAVAAALSMVYERPDARDVSACLRERRLRY